VNADRSKTIRNAALEYVRPNDGLALAVLTLDTTLYFAAVTFAVLSSSLLAKSLAAIIAGTAISMLFILGHDANHRSLFRGKWLNSIASRWTFFPCLHNATLWRHQHNALHHQSTNVKNKNSFSPLSPEEYGRLPSWRRILERTHRNVLGFGLYYLTERWWKHKFFPRAADPGAHAVAAWLDLLLLLVWGSAFITVIIWVDGTFGEGRPTVALVFGFVIPFLVWNQLMGLTAFLQHTHPRALWAEEDPVSRPPVSQIDYTILVNYPRWYDYLSHNIMQHPVHHVNARIPWFRLYEAQQRLNTIAGDDVIVERVSLRYVFRLMRECQLYDYEKNIWLDFAGRPTGDAISMLGAPAS